jgi:hypothetical protein
MSYSYATGIEIVLHMHYIAVSFICKLWSLNRLKYLALYILN